ncbi:hypothetical protein OIU76_019074 [Salix suchowensis]|nr:hypothetical protein OIU76_019074 [Salix suchowensis]
MDSKSNQSPIARILVEFLEVAITSVVFLKGVYPSDAFERRRYMNVVVQRARHPQLRDYIHSAVSGLLPFIEKGLVERVASYGSKVEEGDLEFSLRSFLVKLSVAEGLTKVLPRDCRWEITAYFSLAPSCQHKQRCRFMDTNRHKTVAATSTNNTNQIHE